MAVVGKGGSGKTTFSALFIQYLLAHQARPVWAIDADLNMHLAESLGVSAEELKLLTHISDPAAERAIKEYLAGRNEKIKDLSHFKKSTPPSAASGFIWVGEEQDPVLTNYALRQGARWLSVVGSYHAEGIGASCYHNNLAVLESMLSHTIDRDGWVVVDMVAGVDAFAGTLHAQFDQIILVLEPTKKSVEVYTQYKTLAQEAEIWDQVQVVGNKILTPRDVDFLRAQVAPEKLLGYLNYSAHIQAFEQGENRLDVNVLETENQPVLARLYERLRAYPVSFNARLKKLHTLHQKYVAQGFIKDRFGDLTGQIDPDFDFEAYIQRHGR